MATLADRLKHKCAIRHCDLQQTKANDNLFAKIIKRVAVGVVVADAVVAA